MAKFITHAPCPTCGSSDALSLYDDNSSYCFSCKTLTGSDGKVHEGFSVPPLTPIAVPRRGITLETVAKYDCGRAGDCFYFPYYDKGKKVGAKVRPIVKDNMHVIGTNANLLFGTRTAYVGKGSRSHLIITEGEFDALAANQMLDISAVSIPNGCDSAVKSVKANLKWIEQFSRVYICFDDDEPGQNAQSEVLTLLRPGVGYSVRMTHHKDACDYLASGDEDLFIEAIQSATTELPRGIKPLAASIDDTMAWFEGDAAVGTSTGFPGLDRLTGGLRGGEVTSFVSGLGLGKSTMVRQLLFNYSQLHNLPVFYLPLEETENVTNIQLAELKLGRSILKDRNITAELLRSTITEVRQLIHVFDNSYGFTRQILKDTLEYAVRQYDCKLLVVDNISVFATQAEDERRAIDGIMQELKSLAVRYNVHIIVVAHINRSSEDADDNQPTLARIRGSQGIGMFSDCVLAVSRERESRVSEVRTLKQSRLWGEQGSFKVEWNPATRRVEEYGTTTTEVTPSVQKRLRTEDKSDKPQPSVRTGQVQISSSPPIHSRLEAAKRDVRGDQGAIPSGRPSEDGAYAETAPRGDSSPTLPECQENTELSKQDDLRRLGFKAPVRVGRRNSDTSGMVRGEAQQTEAVVRVSSVEEWL